MSLTGATGESFASFQYVFEHSDNLKFPKLIPQSQLHQQEEISFQFQFFNFSFRTLQPRVSAFRTSSASSKTHEADNKKRKIMFHAFESLSIGASSIRAFELIASPFVVPESEKGKKS